MADQNSDADAIGTFDYIIAGAGSAGCVLANRLSADPKNRVLVLEGGGNDNWIWFHIPVGYLFAIDNPRSDWMFKTAEEPGLNGRALAYPRGKVIGGCSAINAMIYMRGQAADYDGWRQLGLNGWGWDDVLPYFKKHEDHFDPPSDLHAAGGEWRVEDPRVRWDILDRVRDAAKQAGIAKISDFNSGDNEGNAYFQVNQKNGRRWSAARGFLKPVLNRPNLRLETGVHVERVLFDGKRAIGVEFSRAGQRLSAKAEGEVILVETAEDVARITPRDPSRLAFITQTTLSVDDTADVVAALKARFPQIVGPHKEDICYATTNRQAAVKEMAPKIDALLVVGAPNSSNSQRLVEVGRAAGCAYAMLVQSAADIDWRAIEGVGGVGVTAGASAPEVLVEGVIESFRRRFELDIVRVVTAEENISFKVPRILRMAV